MTAEELDSDTSAEGVIASVKQVPRVEELSELLWELMSNNDKKKISGRMFELMSQPWPMGHLSLTSVLSGDSEQHERGLRGESMQSERRHCVKIATFPAV